MGSEALKETHLKPALRGEKEAAFAITEPNAGSDAASLKTRASKQGGRGYLINGSKIFTSNGTVADFITVVATVDPSRVTKGLKLFLVDTDKRAGRLITLGNFRRVPLCKLGRITRAPTAEL